MSIRLPLDQREVEHQPARFRRLALAPGIDLGDEHFDRGARHAQGYPPAINAGTMTVMASYSSWNGQKMHGNKSLLTDVLKGRMGFAGFVVGDWNGHDLGVG